MQAKNTPTVSQSLIRAVDKALLSIKSPNGKHDRSLHLADHEIDVAVNAVFDHLIAAALRDDQSIGDYAANWLTNYRKGLKA